MIPLMDHLLKNYIESEVKMVLDDLCHTLIELAPQLPTRHLFQPVVQDGYKFHFPDRNCVTVWSAPNYCYRCGNIASYLNVNENLWVEDDSFGLFDAVPLDQSKIPKTGGQYFL